MNIRTFILLLLVAACPLLSSARLNVVATTEDFGSIARSVGGDRVTVTTLARPTEDPHFVDPKPSFIAKLNRADAIILGGAELEIGWLPPLLESARNRRLAAGQAGRIDCVRGVAMLEVPVTLDRTKGDIHAAGNPHFMTDPVNGRIAAEHICDAFCRLDPDAAGYYRSNLASFTSRLEDKLEEWRNILAPFRGQRIVAYHNSWPYFAERFGLKIDLFLEPIPGIPPTPAHLATVVDRIQTERLRVVITEPFVSRRTAEAVSRETGIAILEASQFPGGVKGTEAGYIEWMDYLVHAVARALGQEKGANAP